MEAAAQAQTTLTATDPVQRWLARRSAGAPPSKKLSPPTPSLRANSAGAQRARRAPEKRPGTVPRRAPFCANPIEARRSAINRANSAHSTGPRTETGKQRSSLNALSHGLTARTAVLPTEDPDTYERHIQQFLDEYQPATATETQLVHEIASAAWRLNRIPLLETELLSHNPNPHTLIPILATLGLHGSAPLPPVPKRSRTAPRHPRSAKGAAHTANRARKLLAPHSVLRDHSKGRRLERRQLTEAAELFLRHQHKGLPWDPADDFSEQAGFVFSKEQVERHARQLMRNNPFYYAPHPRFQADPPPTEAAF